MAPINRSRKGTRHEAIVKEYLERNGWIVHRAVRTRFQSQDIFGADLVAKNHNVSITRYLQITAGGSLAKKKDEFAKYPWLVDEQPEIMIWRPDGPRRGPAHYEWHVRFREGWCKQRSRLYVKGGRIVND